MADPLSIITSVSALAGVAKSICEKCRWYANSVRNAREDIASLQSEMAQCTSTLENLADLLRNPDTAKLVSSRNITVDIDRCRTALTALNDKLDPGKGKRAMSRLGIRALKWPWKHDELENLKSDISGYRASINLALQVDQTALLTKISRATERVGQNLDLGKLPVVKGAEFDSYLNQSVNECFPGTRIKVLERITEWATAKNGKCMFWLNGMAGSGKSTIARTMSRAFHSKSILGASFFFKRGEGGRGNAMGFITTIARQLVANLPMLLPKLRTVLEDDSEISTKSIKEQFQRLLLQPLSNLQQTDDCNLTRVIVVDALDECEPQDVQILLQLLPQLQTVKLVNIRFFLTSRPELPIRMGLMRNEDAHQDLVLHEIPIDDVRKDIALFLQHRLGNIRRDRCLPTDWPGDTNFEKLVLMSGPLFVFAATICRIFEDPQWDPEDSLSEILSRQHEESQLSGTYLPVLNQLLASQGEPKKQRLIKEFKEIVGPVIFISRPLPMPSLSRLICQPEKVIRLRLNTLQSVIRLPQNDNGLVMPYHISLRDFLLDPSTRTKTPFWLDGQEMDSQLAGYCLKYLRTRLRKNILDLPSYGSTAFWDRRNRKDIEEDLNLPPELQYACIYWIRHFVLSSPSKDDIADAADFLEEHFLHWMEAICTIDSSGYLVGLIRCLQPIFDGHVTLSAVLRDAEHFLDAFRELGHHVPLQLYSAGLVFSPSGSSIREKYSRERHKKVRFLPRVPDTWDRLAEGDKHSSFIDEYLVLDFSPDGKLLAAARRNHTVELWDPITGTLQLILKGPQANTCSFAFSPSDSRILVTSSWDDKVRIWDLSTGVTLHTFEQRCPTKIELSPDGRLLALAQEYGGITILDATTGTLQQHIDEHAHSLAFSPNGNILAFGSCKGIIKIWDLTEQALQRTLGSEDTAIALAFSADGETLAASTYNNKNVQLWQPSTGAPIFSFISTARANRLEFSRDGGRLLTDTGTIDIRSLRGTWDVCIPRRKNTVWVERVWVMVGDDPVLFLPKAYLPCCWAAKDGIVALANGGWNEVTFVGFELED